MISEIDAALVDHVEFYLLNYFEPAQYDFTPRAKQGQFLFHISRMRHLS